MGRLWKSGSTLLLTLFVSTGCFAQSGNPVVYVYDELGRLVAVTNPNSDTVVYNYDAVGNILSISRYSSTKLSIIRFDPSSGPIGATVTISGTGFSSTISQNTVQFNGTTATVSSATSTQLIVTVPNGAATGPISVTTLAGTATTSTPFTVTAGNGLPTITSFVPTIGAAGTAVSITGTNFDPIPANDEVEFNITQTSASSGTSTSLATVVPPVATSGHVGVRTLAGKAVSSNYFFVPPSPYSVSSVQYTGQIAMGGQTSVAINTAGDIGLLVFDGVQGKGVSITTSAGTFGSCNLGVSILTPTGTTLGSNSCMGSSGLLGSLTLPTTGTYTILLSASFVSPAGTVTVNLYDATDITATITPNGSLVTSTVTVPGQKVRLSFRGAYQQVVSSELVGFGGNSFTASILAPDGVNVASTSGINQLTLIGNALQATGTFQILITPSNGVTGSVTTSLISQTTNPTINFGTPLTNTINPTSLLGFSFSGTAGQIVSVEAAGLGNGFFNLYVLNPNGSTLASGFGNGQIAFVSKTLATTGTYQIVIAPNGGVIGSVTTSLISQTTNPTISFGTPLTNTINPTSLLGFSFSGTAGQIVSVEAAGLGNGFFNLYVLNPDGSTLASGFGGGQLALVGKTLATTGTYQIVIAPNGGVTGSVTTSLISQTTNPTISFGTPLTNTINPASLLGFSFSGTSGQIVSVEAAGLGNGFFNLYILNPDGSTLASGFGGGQLALVGKTLATTGTYQIVIAPYNGVTGTMAVSLISQTTNPTISFGTPLTNTINPASLLSFSFSGTAGQIVSVEAAGLGNGLFTAYVLNPDGSTLVSGLANGQIAFVGKTLATTGTYQIVIAPYNGVTGSMTVSLISQTTNGTISFGTPVTDSISVSSLIGLSFSGTGGQTASIQITPSFSSGLFSVYVLNPDGSTLVSGLYSGAVTFSQESLSSTGTYQIILAPYNAVTGSATISLTSP